MVGGGTISGGFAGTITGVSGLDTSFGGSRGGTTLGSGGSGGEVGATFDGEASISASFGLSGHLQL